MSRIGLSTYAFFWQLSNRMEHAQSLHDVLERTAEFGVDLFQICDYPALESMTNAELAALKSHADQLNISLELGTRGIRRDHINNYLRIATALDARILRTLLHSQGHTPNQDEATEMLSGLIPELQAAAITLALETYEAVPTEVLLGVVRAVDSPCLGICSDPANTVAALESPREVIDAVAPHVVNMHIKDFAFSRQAGWVGFSYAGAPLGEGLLDYDYMYRKFRPQERNINQIIEHWLPWQETPKATAQRENQWTQQSINFLRRK